MSMATLYSLKPDLQAMLRPFVAELATSGVRANEVTIASALASSAVGLIVTWNVQMRLLFLLIPIWLFVRMALNAADGMLAREFDQKSKLGAYLNEIGDVVSDIALYVPFAFVPPLDFACVGLVIVLSIVSEFAGALGPTVGASRRYEGPLGKSDRALIFGALAFWVGIGGALPGWLAWLMPSLALLLLVTAANR